MAVGPTILIISKTIYTQRVDSSAGFICKQRALHEEVLDLIFGAAVFGGHVDPQIVVAMETMWARAGVKASDLSTCFLGVALAREGRKSGN